MKLKLNINTVLPFALALIMPGMSYYTNTRGSLLESGNMYLRWGIVSTTLYILWHLLWNLPTLNTDYKNWKVWGLLVLFIGISWGVSYRSNVYFDIYSLVRLTFAVVIILIVQYAVKAQKNIANLRVEKEQMQTENYRVQLKALQNRVDPHFLFNSLNTLRSMVRQQHDNSEKFIMSLSDFYRQTLQHNENTTLRLEEELNVLESYLFLMKSRNEQAVNVHIKVNETSKPYYLPTLALQVVVENCFKHNSMTSKMPLRIEIKGIEDDFIEVINNIQPKIGGVDSSGYGLDMLKKRYALMNINEGVIVDKTADEFRVKLKLIQHKK